MILQALNHYYERIADDREVEIARFGFSLQKIGFCVVLEPDGRLAAIEPLLTEQGKKKVPRRLIVPGGAKPSGSGINPNFLWDNTAYLLGYEVEDPKPEKTRASFEGFRDRHLALEKQIDDPDFAAVCRFLATWDPARVADYPELAELVMYFGAFRVQGKTQFVHNADRVLSYWRSEIEAAESGPMGQCLITGETAPLARLHQPLIKGVFGAQTMGAAIVSFNCDAFESYGKEQALNAPASKHAVFQYATALNYLLSDQSRQRFRIADTTVVYWAERRAPAETFFADIMQSGGAEDEAAVKRIESCLGELAAGNYPFDDLGDSQTPFYVLGLSPSASRVSIRFWWAGSIGAMIERVRQHFDDMAIVRARDHDPQFPPAWYLLHETARDDKGIPPLLSGGLLRAILTGQRYPETLYTSVLRRIRADGVISYGRAAILKAVLNRNTRLAIRPLRKELPVSLDPDRPESAYHLGRLFAVLEGVQRKALPEINSTIKDRFFGAASATPSMVFPRVMRLTQHHLGKIESRGLRTFFERQIGEICDRLQTFKPHLNLDEQGLFTIGYYHQREHRATNTNEANTAEQGETEKD